MKQYSPAKLVTMAAASYHGRLFQETLETRLGIPVDVLPNTQFLIGRYNPLPDPEPHKRYVMEGFYRDMRRHFDLLMEGDEPAGGQWNFDAENRKKLPQSVQPPPPISFAPAAITREVMAAGGGAAGRGRRGG